MSPPKIIAFSGKIGSGKNYLAEKVVFDYLRKQNKNVLIVAFADHPKITCHVKDGVPYEKLFHDKDEETRKILQTRGMLERKDNDKIFIDIVNCSIRLAFERGVDVVLVTDLRFKNEFQFLKELGATLIRVNAPKRSRDKLLKECNGDEKKADIIASHISEKDLDDCGEFDHYLGNDYKNLTEIKYEIKIILDKYYLEHSVLNNSVVDITCSG